MAQLRLLVTNGDAVESISRATHVAFDKTGTLTRGEPVIVDTRLLAEDRNAADLLKIAAALESASTHPLARAFQAVATPYRPEQVETHIGAGLAGIVDGQLYRLGSADFVPGADRYAEELADDRPTIYLGDDDRPLAIFVVDDAPREDAAATLDALRRMGLGISLMSGDREAAVARLAGELGIGDYAAECTPEGKLDRLAARQQAGEVIIMVGDGINDAPVLAGADASIAPAHSALLAQTSADVIMLGDRLGPVVTAIELSRKTLRIVRQNLAWAILYNAAALPLAIAGYVPPWLAAIGMSASSLIVVVNALRLSRAGNDSRVITA